jgi:creatinine amidohydrolase
MPIYFREANWVKVRQCAEADGVAVLPLASLEQHGPHLPCGTDIYQINEIMRRGAQRLPTDAAVCVCPTVEYSVVQWASPMASAGVAPLTLEQSLVDICHALTDLGFQKISLVHGHGGLSCGQSALWQALQEKRPALYVDFKPYDACGEQIRVICGEPITHAGAAETSMMLAIRPDLVDISKAVKGPADLWGDHFPYPSLVREGCYTIPPVTVTREGVYGDATRASAEIGARLLDLMAEVVATALGELVSSPVPDQWKSISQVPLPQ